MKVLLLKEVDNLGAEGEVVTVKDGYGRNFLIPRGLARMASAGTIRAREEELRQASRKIAQAREEAQATVRRLESLQIDVPARVGEEDRIFGTVTAQQVAVALAAQGFDVDRRKVELNEEIRKLGVYTATVRLHPEVAAQVKVRVVPEEDSAA